MNKFKVGDYVTYQKNGKTELGRVKSIADEENVFVVYNCAGAWEHFESYTAARTNVNDLVLGWTDKVKTES